MSNGFNGNGLGSFVMPIGDDNGPSSPPLTEIGSPSIFNTIFGYTPGWSNFISVDELEHNSKLLFPNSIDTYHTMRTDPQIQGLLTGAIWPLLRMKWYINPNNAPDEMVEHIATDLNLPIIDPHAPPKLVMPDGSPVPPSPDPTNTSNQDRRSNDINIPFSGKPINSAVAPPTPTPRTPQNQAGPTPLMPQLVSQQEQPFYRRRSQGRFNFLNHIEEALDAIAYGFEVFEQEGFIGDDGLFHYKKLAQRPPQTITQIDLARDGGVIDVRQGGLIDVPLTIDRLVIYSFQKRGANWHGRSLLRGCYEPWLLKDRAVRVGVMNIQRAGVGVPVATGSPGMSDTDLKVLNQMMTRLNAGDRSGGAIPYGASVKLIGVEGGQPDTVGFVKLMNEEMARSFFQMFMQLGQTTSGSRALGQTFVEYHKLVTEYIAQWFAGIFNEHVIEDDIDWNWGTDEEYAPLLEWKWDTEGSEQNPQGPAAAKNPTQAFQQMAQNNQLELDDAMANALFS